MPTIATDGKGNYVALDDSGNWVPTEAPASPQKGGGELGYPPAPPDKDQKQPIDFATRQAGPPPSLDELGLPLPQPSPGGWRDVVDTSITPRPGVATFAPLSRETPTSPAKFAVPNAVRALFTEGPQGYLPGPQGQPQSRFETPAATINPDTRSLGVTQEAAAAGSLLQPGGLRGINRPYVPPGVLSPEFLQNPLGPSLAGRETPLPSGPTTPTGVQVNRLLPEMRTAPPEPSPSPEPSPAAASTSTVPLTADEILTRSKQFYSPADQQAAQGAMINPGPSNGIRRVLTDAVPTDPQTAIAKGSTPLTQLGKDYADFQGQPMSFDAVMQLDRRLTAEKRTAMRNDPDMARQIGEAQDKIRDKMQALGPDDTTGDPSALAGLQQARQAYAQYIKQSQLEDIRYGATLLPPEKQDAFVQNRTRALLKSDQSRNWTPDERAAAEAAVTQGVRGFLSNAGISIIKPLATAAGFKVAGPGGAWLGSTIGEAGQTTLRDALARRRPDRLGPVSSTITQGVPLAPTNRLAPGVGSVDPDVMAALQEQLRQSAARQARDTSTP